MANGQQILDLASKHIGEKYVLGALVPKDYKEYSGPWDCAEFASWLVYQTSGKLYGCANNLGNPRGADAYSGFWYRDAMKLGKIVPLNEAAKIPGAFVIRVAGPDIIGHVVISNGAGGTVEAHSNKAGVIASSLDRRRWTCGVLIPWVEYDYLDLGHPPIKQPPKIYRWTSPMMKGEKIKEIQTALAIKADGYYGPKTFNAVRSFQRNESLVADGEVGPHTAARLGITI